MISEKTIPKNVPEYIRSFPSPVKQLLEQIRAAIKAAAPKAEEVISYQMPAYRQNGMLVYFAGYKNHIGFYPTASGIVNFKKEIALYRNSKGAVQFPVDEPLPLALITKMVKFRVKENEQKAYSKKIK